MIQNIFHNKKPIVYAYLTFKSFIIIIIYLIMDFHSLIFNISDKGEKICATKVLFYIIINNFYIIIIIIK